jgi:hypothetical protein
MTKEKPTSVCFTCDIIRYSIRRQFSIYAKKVHRSVQVVCFVAFMVIEP